MLPLRLRPAALAELTDAWQWYEQQLDGLGDEFRACVESAFLDIARVPRRWPRVHGEARRRLVRRFPYAVIYIAEPDHVEVLAVFHASRDPTQWKGRA